MTTAAAMTTPQNNRFNKQKQLLCTCVLHFGTFLCSSLQSNNVICPHLRFCGEGECTAGIFHFLSNLYATPTNLVPG